MKKSRTTHVSDNDYHFEFVIENITRGQAANLMRIIEIIIAGWGERLKASAAPRLGGGFWAVGAKEDGSEAA